MKLVHDKAQLRRACDAARQQGQRVGVIPTMGALHNGHLALMKRAKQEGASFRVTTIFVNPLQFAQGEDLGSYPRSLEADAELCRKEGVDVVYCPKSEDMYPSDFQTEVSVTRLTQQLEGAHRPSHFVGVTTVVTKLLCRVGPCIAVFGKKDYQQWRVIERMVGDLDLPTQVVGHPIERDEDGLALSSRNRYLSQEERQRALSLPRALQGATDMWDASKPDAETLVDSVRQALSGFDSIDYVSASDPDSLTPASGRVKSLLISVAAHIGKTRLIDNVELF